MSAAIIPALTSGSTLNDPAPSSSSCWLLIDCNNFFVSCERAFRPDLWQKPVLVLSCNDGCTVSRSNEVKKLGIAMGAPLFQIRDIVRKNQVQIFSSNFRLYANLSNRVMKNAAQFANHQEVYSIDECFLDGSEFNFSSAAQAEAYGLKIKNHLWQATGIPVTVGIAPTKTLAKLATEIAKKDPLGAGVLSFTSRPLEQIISYLAHIDVNDIWGIGRQSAKLLLNEKIFTALDFYQLPQAWVKKKLGLGSERTWLELHSQACILAEDSALRNKALTCSRSFGDGTTSFSDLQAAVATFTAQAARRLRKHHYRATFVTVYISTSRFIDPQHRDSGSYTISLPQSTAFTPDLVTAATKALRFIFKKGFAYKKAGVTFSGIEAADAWQPALTTCDPTITPKTDDQETKLMQTLDQLNAQFGSQTIRVASQGLKFSDQHWSSNSKFCSPNYLHDWSQIPSVR